MQLLLAEQVPLGARVELAPEPVVEEVPIPPHLLVDVDDPDDKKALAALEAATGWRLRPALAVRAELLHLVAGDVLRGARLARHP